MFSDFRETFAKIAQEFRKLSVQAVSGSISKCWRSSSVSSTRNFHVSRTEFSLDINFASEVMNNWSAAWHVWVSDSTFTVVKRFDQIGAFRDQTELSQESSPRHEKIPAIFGQNCRLFQTQKYVSYTVDSQAWVSLPYASIWYSDVFWVLANVQFSKIIIF